MPLKIVEIRVILIERAHYGVLVFVKTNAKQTLVEKNNIEQQGGIKTQ